jgi:hypothetical protein
MLQQSVDYQRTWRQENSRHFAFYDGDQWTADDLQILADRRQHPTVINLTRPTVDMIAALLISGGDDVVLAGREPSDEDVAGEYTALLRQVEDSSKFRFHRNAAILDGLKGGIGWIHLGVTGKGKKASVWGKRRPWHEFYWDPYAVEPCMSDARFIARSYWMDRDAAMKKWPDKKSEIENLDDSMFGSDPGGMDDYHSQEQDVQIVLANQPLIGLQGPNGRRVRIIEMYYRDAQEVIRRIVFTCDVALEGDIHDDSKNVTPFNDKEDMIPFVPFCAFRDRHGNPQGVINFFVSLQEMINKANSKYIHTLSSYQAIYEQGAVKDEQALIEQLAQPDTVIMVEDGALQSKRIEINKQFPELVHLREMVMMYISLFQRVSGVNDSLSGLGGTNARSAAQEAGRSEKGAVMQTTIFESFAHTNVEIAERMLKMVAQFYPDDTKVRILAPEGTTEFVSFDGTRPSILVDKDTGDVLGPGEGIKRSIKDVLKYDVIFKRVPQFDTIREQQMQVLGEVFKTLVPSGAFPPDIAARILIENMDALQNKGEILRILKERFEQQQQAAAQAPQGI